MLLGSGLCAMREPRLPRIPPAIRCPVLLFTCFCQIKNNFSPDARQAKLELKLSVLCTLEGIVLQAVKLKQQTMRIEAMEYALIPMAAIIASGLTLFRGLGAPADCSCPSLPCFSDRDPHSPDSYRPLGQNTMGQHDARGVYRFRWAFAGGPENKL